MKILYVPTLIALIFLLIGCSSGNPVNPSDVEKEPVKISQIPLGVRDITADGVVSGGQGVLGLFEITAQKDTLTADLTSLRNGSLVDVLEEVDITNFLQLAPCTDCVKIDSVSLNDDGNLVLTIGIRHPFSAGDPLKPPTGRNRADLHVFNVEGIVISNADITQFPGIGKSIANFKLLSADGYTPYLDEVVDSIYPTDATIHPYVLHFDDYSQGNYNAANPMGFASVTEPPPSGNLVMAMGCNYNLQDYVFDLSSGDIDFIFAVGCTYGISASSKSMRFSPFYNIPQHNKKAASEVRVEILNNELKGEDETSSADLVIKVLDINHGVGIGEGIDKMYADSSVGAIAVEVPGVTSSPIILSSPVPTGGDGRDPDNPLTFPVTITNSAQAAGGIYAGLVKVTDTYSPGLNTSPLLNGMDGIKRVGPIENPLSGLFAISEFATYAVFYISVEAGTTGPTACFTTEPSGTPDLNIPTCSVVEFDASCSTDDSAITLYEWDFDWNGIEANFSDDTSGANQVTISKFFGVDGSFEVALRVTNDAIPALTDITSITVTASGQGNEEITDSSTTAINMDRARFMDLVISHDNWVYVLNKGTYNGDQGIWVYRSCALGDGWLDPIQVSTNSLDDNPVSCSISVTGNGRPVVSWIDNLDNVCVSVASDDTGTSWSARQEVYGVSNDLRHVDMACYKNNSDYAIISFIDYDCPSGFPHRIHSYWSNNLLSGSPTWNPCGSGTYVGYWTIWDVQDVDSEFTSDGELDQVVWRKWPTTTTGNQVYHRRWTPGGQYGTWSACCGYVSSSGAQILSTPDLIVDSMNRPFVAFARAENKTSGIPLPPWKLFINRGTDASQPVFGTQIEIATSTDGNIDKPSVAQDPNTGNYWIVYNSYDTDPSTPSQILRAIVDESLSIVSVDVLWNDNDSSNTLDDSYPHITYASDSGIERMITIWRNTGSPNPNIQHRLDDL
jgi:hypothetical protein